MAPQHIGNPEGYHRDVSKPPMSAITSLPPSPDEERHARMVKYALAMGIRLVCILSCFFVPGWWLIIPATGAIVLPYVAVVAANTVVRRQGAAVERPGALLRVRRNGEA